MMRVRGSGTRWLALRDVVRQLEALIRANAVLDAQSHVSVDMAAHWEAQVEGLRQAIQAECTRLSVESLTLYRRKDR